jgi:hypothetical protein
VGHAGPVGENVHRTADRARVARRWGSPLSEGLGFTRLESEKSVALTQENLGRGRPPPKPLHTLSTHMPRRCLSLIHLRFRG